MSLRASQWVWGHSPARNGARLVHLALADASYCNRGHKDLECSCGEVLTRRISRAELADMTGLSTSAVKNALAGLVDLDLVDRRTGGYGTEVSRWTLRLLEPPSGCGCGFCERFTVETLRTAPNAAGARYWPPVDEPVGGGPDSAHGGPDSGASGSDSGPYTETEPLQKKSVSTFSDCGEPLLTRSEILDEIRSTKELLGA